VKLKIIVLESQKKKILKKTLSSLIYGELEKNADFAEKVLPKSKNSKYIGGFLRPVDDYIRDVYPDLSDKEINLILCCITSIYFNKNSKINDLYSEMKKLGIDKYMKPILNKTDELYDKFYKFLNTKGIKKIKGEGVNNYLSLIPILPKLI